MTRLLGLLVALVAVLFYRHWWCFVFGHADTMRLRTEHGYALRCPRCNYVEWL